MAQMQADRRTAGAVDSDGRVNSLGRLTYAIGSVISVGLVIGMGVWGYKLLVRDVSGVPVIRAAEGPMRVQPENPGGRLALHQGLSVNAVAAAGSAEAAADRLILAPAPLDLDFVEVQADVPAPRAEMASSDAKDIETADLEPAEATDADLDENAKMLALAEALSEGVPRIRSAESGTDSDEEARLESEDVVAAEPEAGAEGVTEAETETAAVERVEGGIGRSLRPRLRPAALTSVQPVSASAMDAPGAPQEVDPATIPVGTRLAQLGAYKSEEIAREEWTRLSGRFEEYLAGKDRVIQRAESGGRTFYRLRALGFDDLADARRFCSALVAERAECIPVVTR